MWNQSDENWGGETQVRTGEETHRNIEIAGNIKTYIAMSCN